MSSTKVSRSGLLRRGARLVAGAARMTLPYWDGLIRHKWRVDSAMPPDNDAAWPWKDSPVCLITGSAEAWGGAQPRRSPGAEPPSCSAPGTPPKAASATASLAGWAPVTCGRCRTAWDVADPARVAAATTAIRTGRCRCHGASAACGSGLRDVNLG